MRTPTFVVCALVGAGLFSLPSRAAAQIDCGSVSRDLRIYQEHGYQYVSLTAYTSRSISVCPLQVRVEAWIEGAEAPASRSRPITPRFISAGPCHVLAGGLAGASTGPSGF